MSYVDPDKLFSLEDARAYFGVNYMTLWRWVDKGKITATKTPGGEWRVKGSTINAHLKSSENLRGKRGRPAKKSTPAEPVAA